MGGVGRGIINYSCDEFLSRDLFVEETTRWFCVRLFPETIIKIILNDKEKNVQHCMKCALCLASWKLSLLIRIPHSHSYAKLKLIELLTISFPESLFTGSHVYLELKTHRLLCDKVECMCMHMGPFICRSCILSTDQVHPTDQITYTQIQSMGSSMHAPSVHPSYVWGSLLPSPPEGRLTPAPQTSVHDLCWSQTEP